MASKRNSRIVVDGARANESVRTPYRSNSRSSSKENDDFMDTSKEAEEAQRGHTATKECNPNPRPQGVTVGTEGSTPVTSVQVEVTVSAAKPQYPIAPLNGRPENFGVVTPGVYRSGYPKAEDFGYLEQLRLKTIVTLVKKDEVDADLQKFINANRINQFTFAMKGTKKEAIPLHTMKSILDVILDRRNYPMMIHCNHGKHRTGCVIAVMRYTLGWNQKSVVDEYRTYAEPKIRDVDVEYISSFETSSLWVQPESPPRVITFNKHNFRRALAFATVVMLLWFVSSTSMISNKHQAIL